MGRSARLAVPPLFPDGMNVPRAVAWALAGKRVGTQWATALRAWEKIGSSLGWHGLPPDYGTGQFRMCEFIYELGMVRGLRVVTVRKYVGNVHSWWRAVDPRLVPDVKLGGLYRLALARYAEFDRRLPEQYMSVTHEMLREVMTMDLPVVVKSAVMFGYSYVARTGEYVRSEHSDDWDRNLVRAGDVEYIEATSTERRRVRVSFSTRKNNTASKGKVQVSQRVELEGDDKTLCVVTWMFAMRDERRALGLGDAPARGPIFLVRDGAGERPLAGADIARLALRPAAASLGLPAARLSSYGLRTGSATQMKRAGVEEVLIMLAGGWASASGMRGYCHDIAEDSEWLAEALADPAPTARAAAVRAAAAALPLAGVKRPRGVAGDDVRCAVGASSTA